MWVNTVSYDLEPTEKVEEEAVAGTIRSKEIAG